MKLQATILALAFCFGVGCADIDDPQVTVAPAALSAADGGRPTIAGGGQGTPQPEDNPNDPGRVQQECDDRYHDCVFGCGLSPTPAHRRCGKRCDDRWLECLSIVIE